MYTALYMPGDGTTSDPSQPGIPTEEAALKYIENRICDSCKRRMKESYVYPTGDIEEPETCVLNTSCGAEWTVMLDSEAEQLFGNDWFANRPQSYS